MSPVRSTNELKESEPDGNRPNIIHITPQCAPVQLPERNGTSCDSQPKASRAAGDLQPCGVGGHAIAHRWLGNKAGGQGESPQHDVATDGWPTDTTAALVDQVACARTPRKGAQLELGDGLDKGAASGPDHHQGQSELLSTSDSYSITLGALPTISAAPPLPPGNAQTHVGPIKGEAGGSRDEVQPGKGSAGNGGPFKLPTPPIACQAPKSGLSVQRDSSDRGPQSDGSHGWMDTATMWSNVQTRGEELQRRQRLQPASSSCRGVDWMAGPRRLHKRVRTQLVVMARVVTKYPMTAIVPLVVLLCLLAFGLWGVFSVAYALRDGRRQSAINAAQDLSQTLTSHILATVAPASTTKMMILLERQVPDVNASFYRHAPDLVRKATTNDAVITIILAPQGIVESIIPEPAPDNPWYQVYGYNLLKETRWRNDALKTIRNYRQGMVMTGPSTLRVGTMGLVTRYAVFVGNATEDELFGGPSPAYECGDLCWERTGQLDDGTPVGNKFWGFAQLAVDWEVLTRNVSRLYDLCDRDGLAFNMTYIDPVTGENRTIAHSEGCGTVGKDPVWVHVDVMLNHWVLAVTDRRGWTPEWLPLVVAVVVVVSLWVAVAMAVIMINRREHMWLLQAMLPKKVIATLRRGEDYLEAFENVTVLFSDVVSYTTMASEMEPLQVVRLLNLMYSAYDALVDDYACYKVETIGDAFMAVCGTQGEDPVAAAVKVARLAQAMLARTRKLVSPEGQKLQIRIGLHSGPVVGAVLGFKMPHFCLCGDTVNTANRMESNSKPMRIHVSDATQLLLAMSGENFAFEERGLIEVKGKGKMHTWWLLPDNDQRPSPAPRDANAAHDRALASNDGTNGGADGINSGAGGYVTGGDTCRRVSSSRLSSQPGDSDTPAPLQKSPVAAPLTPRRPFLYGSRRGDSYASIGSDGRQTGGSVHGGAGSPGSPASGSVDLMPAFLRSKSKARVDLRLFQAGQGKGQG